MNQNLILLIHLFNLIVGLSQNIFCSHFLFGIESRQGQRLPNRDPEVVVLLHHVEDETLNSVVISVFLDFQIVQVEEIVVDIVVDLDVVFESLTCLIELKKVSWVQGKGSNLLLGGGLSKRSKHFSYHLQWCSFRL